MATEREQESPEVKLRPEYLSGKRGFVNEQGKEFISFKYEDAFLFSEGLAIVSLNGKYGFVDQIGRAGDSLPI